MKNAINLFLSISLASLALQACSCNQSDQHDDANFDYEREWNHSLDELQKWEDEWEKEYEEYEKDLKALEEEWNEEWEELEEEGKIEFNMSKKEYKELLEFYRENYDNLTPEEKENINRQIGQYNGQIVKDEIERAEDAVKKTSERIPSFVEGFISVFKK